MSIQIVEIAQPSVIDTVAVAQPSTVAVVEIRQGPAGAGGGGSATWGGITGTLSAQTDLQTALNLKAPLASPALTGTPTAPNAATTTNTTQLATTAFVQQELAAGTAVAKNLEVFARNETGATLTKGTIVYINGTTGNRPTITKARANNDANSAQTIGFVKADIAHNADGFVIVSGELENVNTGALTGGQQLYLSPSAAGEWTTAKPSAPNHLVYVGIVVRANNSNGIIYVSIQNGYELDEIHDVSITTPAAKQVIKRNAGNTLWVNEAVAASDVTGLGSLATQSGTFSGTHSGTSSGTNTGDQDLSVLLPRLSRITVSGTTPAFPDPLVEQPSLLNGKRWWAGADSSIEFNGTDWLLHYYDGVMDNYDASLLLDSTEEPWKAAPSSWTLVNGAGEPTLSIDPPTLLPLSGASGTIALASDQQGHVAPSDMIGLGSGVAGALAFASDTQNGFLTAGTGGTLPITRGGTGATTAGLARTALGSGATGDALFTAASVAAANTILANNIVTKAADFTLAEADAGTYMRLTKTGSTQTITLPTSGISTGAEFQFYRATTQSLAFSGGTVNGSANLASVPNNGAFALKRLGSGTYDFI